MALLLAVAVGSATLGYWFLVPQQVTFQANYAPILAGDTVAVLVDAGKLSEAVAPSNCSPSVGCPAALGDLWLLRGLHRVRVTIDGTTVLDKGFLVGGRSYAWLTVWNGTANFGLGDTPVGWA